MFLTNMVSCYDQSSLVALARRTTLNARDRTVCGLILSPLGNRLECLRERRYEITIEHFSFEHTIADFTRNDTDNNTARARKT